MNGLGKGRTGAPTLAGEIDRHSYNWNVTGYIRKGNYICVSEGSKFALPVFKIIYLRSCLTVLTDIGFEILTSLTKDCCLLECCTVSCHRSQYSLILTEFYTENV